jgi:hypothetical protein
LRLDVVGATARLGVTATYAGWGAVDVTSATAGTAYTILSGGTTVVSVDADGLVEARGAGADAIVVSHGGLSTAVSVSVVITNGAPVLAPLSNVALWPGSFWALPLSATDPDGDVLVLSGIGLPSFASIVDYGGGMGSLELRPQVSDGGQHALAVSATDDGVPTLGGVGQVVVTVLTDLIFKDGFQR